MRVLAITTSIAMIAVASWAEPCRATAEDRHAAPATAAKSQVDVQKRVRELIYVLRCHRVTARVEEWASAIRELVQLGRPAVPEIVAELDRTDRAVTLRGLAFTLRSIGDPRAIPALIRALGKTNVEVGTYDGVYVLDTKLMAFMQEHQHSPARINGMFLYGRPIDEISSALVRICHRADQMQPLVGGMIAAWVDEDS